AAGLASPRTARRYRRRNPHTSAGRSRPAGSGSNWRASQRQGRRPPAAGQGRRGRQQGQGRAAADRESSESGAAAGEAERSSPGTAGDQPRQAEKSVEYDKENQRDDQQHQPSCQRASPFLYLGEP